MDNKRKMDNQQIYHIPSSYQERNRLRKLIEEFVSSGALYPPLSMEELFSLSDKLIAEHALDSSCKGWMMVEMNNCLWKETIASIPYEKRMLLLPQCLRNAKSCKAEIDELGLLCHQCMNCSIAGLENKAESLGVMSLVAEGFTSVIELIESGVVETVIGVGCLDSLEKAFPLLINHAVPGMAIPLNKAGCKDTQVDIRYVEEMISLYSDKESDLLDYEWIKDEIKKLFSQENLQEVFSKGNEQTSVVAREWLGGDGKRWRPYLLVATYLALSGKREIPEEVGLTAIAVECFHKASLVHDDIQDNDDFRYGKQTVHHAYGVATAINVGDILLGAGYRLLSSCGNMELLREASKAHISLCQGQGMELEWSLKPSTLDMQAVLEIFSHKTVPAFEVSLLMGLICAGGDASVREALHAYSKALGIAYQLQDDLEDFESNNTLIVRPSAILAVICAQHPEKSFLQELMSRKDVKEILSIPQYKPLLEMAQKQVEEMAEIYHQQAIDALKGITNIELKRLLFRVTKKILK